MKHKLSFGIGCFHFGVKRKHPFKFEGARYIKELKKNLENISNVNNIKISCEDDFEGRSIHITQELPNIENGKGFFPDPRFMKIEFEVYIPFRIQAQISQQLLHRKLSSLGETFTEKFKVSINYTSHLPVTFIELVNPSEEGYPSSAVVIVREFLEHEFKNIKSDHIQFECLGPSPFHANCYIYSEKSRRENDIPWEFQSKVFHQRGYDRVVFHFNSTKFANVQEAKRKIFREIQIELGFFYRLVQVEVDKMSRWEQIQDLIDQLISIQRTKGITNFLKKVFLRSKLINEALVSLTEFKSEELFSRNFSQRHYRNIYSDKEEKYFQPYIDKEIEERFDYPAKEMSQLIAFFESRRTKAVEVLIFLVSAILGGAVGALLTILLAK